MVKVIYCITKKSGLTDEEFFRYWEEVHGPIGARIPHLRRLVQSRRVRISGDSRAPDYDGVAELWFDDLEALNAARESAAWKASTEDEANFIQPGQTAFLVSEERAIFDETKN